MKIVLRIILAFIVIGLIWGAYHLYQINRTQVFSGTIEKVSPDCSPVRYLDEQGNIAKSMEFACDGGSSITVDGIIYWTSPGGETLEQWADISDLNPGDYVEIKAKNNSKGEYKDLSCDSCYVKKLD